MNATASASPSLPDSPAPSGPGQLLQLLRDGEARTRAEIMELTGLARTTVVSRLDALLSTGLIAAAGEAASSGGRPPSRFAFQASARVVLTADIGGSHATVGVADLAGTILARHTEPRDIAEGPESTLAWLLATGRRLLAGLGRDERELAGVGLGLPGPVEHETGRPINPPIMPGWDGYDVPARLGQEWPVPVLVDNDVNIMALGEHLTHWPQHRDFLFVKLATGVGSGIIAGGVLQRGADGTSGDIGHVRVPDGEPLPCRCGNTGCLEALASGPALTAKLRAQGLDVSSGSDVVRRAGLGDIAAIHALRQAGREVGEVLATCVNLLNPSVIVVGGSLSEAGDPLLAGAREAVYRRSQPLATRRLRIERSRAGDDAGILGAARLVIEHLLSPESVEAAIAAS
ncbi:ROK family protein [Arthrobacter sp. NPDC090010]|uniref:ROK family protein n=1 Tax=Arthrobacter sp. NPDC090010 TaxID=3363942 RepID=UPI0038082624